jgi:hypothetical protein
MAKLLTCCMLSIVVVHRWIALMTDLLTHDKVEVYAVGQYCASNQTFAWGRNVMPQVYPLLPCSLLDSQNESHSRHPMRRKKPKQCKRECRRLCSTYQYSHATGTLSADRLPKATRPDIQRRCVSGPMHCLRVGAYYVSAACTNNLHLRKMYVPCGEMAILRGVQRMRTFLRGADRPSQNEAACAKALQTAR